MRYRTAIIIILWLLLKPVVGIAASNPCLKVPNILPREKPYVLDTVTVPVDCELKITAGSTVQFREYAELRIRGVLIIEGSSQQPVILQGVGGASWRGLMGSYGATIHIAHLSYQNSTQGIILESFPQSFRSIHLLNNLTSHIRIGLEGQSFAERFFVTDIWVEDRKLPLQDTNPGMTVIGNDINLVVDRFHIQTPQRGMGRVLVKGTWSIITYNQVSFSGCAGELYHIYQKEFGLKPKANCLEKEVPVLFIPGYGTSLNLFAMLKPTQHGIVVDNLHFIKKLTPGYYDFLDAMQRQNIPYDVAYYDWRQTAENIIKLYIIPAIQKLKKQTQSNYINIVGHSYGGIVAREYIQGETYRNDVHQLIQVGTPNLGAVKAYPVWQAGEFPKDWAAIGSLMRFYGKDEEVTPSRNHNIIHTFFPSVGDLQPIYPALQHGKEFRDPRTMVYQNGRLLQLTNNEDVLHKRTSVSIVVSSSEETPIKAYVQAPVPGDLWPDGKVLGSLTTIPLGGDGTVPTQSAKLAAAHIIDAKGGHQNLPGHAAQAILQRLTSRALPQASNAINYRRITLFSIDCPVFVEVQGTNGIYLTSDMDAINQYTGEGSVFTSADLQWFLLPELLDDQTYTIKITALADTNVRHWFDNQSIDEYYLKKGETKEVLYVEMASNNSVAIEEGEDTSQAVESIGIVTKTLGFQPQKLKQITLQNTDILRSPSLLQANQSVTVSRTTNIIMRYTRDIAFYSKVLAEIQVEVSHLLKNFLTRLLLQE